MTTIDMRSRLYWGLCVLFVILAGISLVSALTLSLYSFYGKGVFLFGYALLNALLAYGFWKRAYWLMPIALINMGGIILIKVIGLVQGVTTWSNLLASVGSAAVLAAFIYATRSSLSGPRFSAPIGVVYLIVLIPVLLRSIGVL